MDLFDLIWAIIVISALLVALRILVAVLGAAQDAATRRDRAAG